LLRTCGTDELSISRKTFCIALNFSAAALHRLQSSHEPVVFRSWFAGEVDILGDGAVGCTIEFQELGVLPDDLGSAA
jgi:hypothetical protein